jgi:hypothetical protein
MLEIERSGRVTTQLRDLLAKTDAGETGSETRTKGRLSAAGIPDRVAENVPNFFFHVRGPS